MGIFTRFWPKSAEKEPKEEKIGDISQKIYAQQLRDELKNKTRELEILKLERQSNLERLRLEKEEAKLEAEIAELTSDDDYENEIDPMTALAGGFMQSFLANRQQPMGQYNAANYSPSSVTQPSQNVQSATVELSDTTIDELLAKLPSNLLKKARSMNEEALGELIRLQQPNLHPNTVTKVIQKIKNK